MVFNIIIKFSLNLQLFILLYRLDGLYQRLKSRIWGGKPDDVSRTAWEVQRFPYEVIGEISDQELLFKLAELAQHQVFIIGKESYNSLVRIWLNKQ